MEEPIKNTEETGETAEINDPFLKKYSKFIFPGVVVIAGFCLIGFLAYSNGAFNFLQGKNQSASLLTIQQAGDKAISFINVNLLQGKATASLKDATEEAGLYKFKIAVGTQEIDSYMTKDGKVFFPEGMKIDEIPAPAQEAAKTVGDFSVSTDEVSIENGKPLVYFFGSETCPHCQWEHPIFTKVAGQFKDLISLHDNMGATDKDMDIFNKYSTGGIPALVFGGKYYRVGSGEASGEAQETKVLTALFCKLTGGQPSSVCSTVSDLISQISE
jgi:thiol-disulfide isomerase/thioredoxin